MAKKQNSFSWLMGALAMLLLVSPAAGEGLCGVAGVVTNIADSTVAAPGEILLDDSDIFILGLITDSTKVMSETRVSTKRTATGTARVESQDYEIFTSFGAVVAATVTCSHQGCTLPQNCLLAGCNPGPGLTCSAPICGGEGCRGTPKGCTKSVTATTHLQ